MHEASALLFRAAYSGGMGGVDVSASGPSSSAVSGLVHVHRLTTELLFSRPPDLCGLMAVGSMGTRPMSLERRFAGGFPTGPSCPTARPFCRPEIARFEP